jgi:hypothetical protein
MRTIFLAALLATTPALAIDFSQPIGSETGEAMKGPDNAPITLGQIAARAVFAVKPDDKIDDMTKFRRGMLGTKLYQGGEIPLSAEEVAMVKAAIAAAFPPLIVYRAWLLLDPATAAQTKAAEQPQEVERPRADSPKP